MTYKGLYAFNLSGHQRWHYPTPGISNNDPWMSDLARYPRIEEVKDTIWF
jgi:hypothetical protein